MLNFKITKNFRMHVKNNHLIQNTFIINKKTSFNHQTKTDKILSYSHHKAKTNKFEKNDGTHLKSHSELHCEDNIVLSQHKRKEEKCKKRFHDNKYELNESELQGVENSSSSQHKSKRERHTIFFYNNEREINESQSQCEENLAVPLHKSKKKKHKKDYDSNKCEDESQSQCEDESQSQCEENLAVPLHKSKKKKHKKDYDSNKCEDESQSQCEENLAVPLHKSKKKKHKKGYDSNECEDESQSQYEENLAIPLHKSKKKKLKKDYDSNKCEDESQSQCEENLAVPLHKSKKKKHKKDYDSNEYEDESQSQCAENLAVPLHKSKKKKHTKNYDINKCVYDSKNSLLNTIDIHDLAEILQEVNITQKQNIEKPENLKHNNCKCISEQHVAHDAHSFAKDCQNEPGENLFHRNSPFEKNFNDEVHVQKKKRKQKFLFSNNFSDHCAKHREPLFNTPILETNLTINNENKNDSNYPRIKKKSKKKKKKPSPDPENSLNSVELVQRPCAVVDHNSDELNCFDSFENHSSMNKKRKRSKFSGTDSYTNKQVSNTLDTVVTNNNFTEMSAILDFDEELPDFDIPLLHQNERVGPLNKNEKEKLIEQGIKIKSGRFTKEENTIFLRNWNNFIKKHKINDPINMFGINCRGLHKKKLKEFLKAKHFYVQLAKDLNDRPLFTIYKHARSTLDPTKDENKLSCKDVNKLLHLHSIHGNKWTVISDLMGKTAGQCESSFRYHGKEQRCGHWTKKEKESLRNAVKLVCKSEKKIKHICSRQCGTSWGKIASIVQTRNSFQCREQWLYRMAWTTKKQKWGTESKLLLVYVLCNNLVEDETLINWKAIYHIFKYRIPSYAALIVKWRKIKRAIIPDYKQKTHPEIMSYLFDNYVPKLMKICKLTLNDLSEKAKE